MTRFSIVLVAVSCFAVCACERHPISGETLVTHTHGSNGAPEAHETQEEGKAEPAEAEKKKEAAPAAAGEEQKGQKAPGGEEKPTFFPEKK